MAVVGAGVIDVNHEEFRSLVRMAQSHESLDVRDAMLQGFDPHDDLSIVLNLLIPGVNGFCLWQKLDAGGELPFDQLCAKLSRQFQIR